jgi:hypothetical protein
MPGIQDFITGLYAGNFNGGFPANNDPRQSPLFSGQGPNMGYPSVLGMKQASVPSPMRAATFAPAAPAVGAPAPATPPPRPTVSTPAPQVATTPQAGNANFWDALRNLFSGQQGPRQGMAGLISPTTGQPMPMSSADVMPMGVMGNYSRAASTSRGQAGYGTNTLGNPFSRFG